MTTLEILSTEFFKDDKNTLEHYLEFKSYFDALDLTEAEKVTLSALMAELGSPVTLMGYLSVIRPDMPAQHRAKAVAYLMAAAFIKNPLPPTFKCARCALEPYCPRHVSTLARGCPVFVPALRDITFALQDNKGHYMAYDRGIWAHGKIDNLGKSRFMGGLDVAMKWVKSTCVASVHLAKPTILLKYEVRPNKKETYKAYVERVDAIVARINARFATSAPSEDSLTPEDKIKMIFQELGHGELLATSFGGNVMAMANAFFPGKTPAAIINQFSVQPKSHKVTSKEVYAELKADKEATREPSV